LRTRRISEGILAGWMVISAAPCSGQDEGDRPRVSDLGLRIGRFSPGSSCSITDVPGVRVGHATLRDEDLCTGVTAVVPHAGDLFHDKVRAAVFVGNGFGKLVGTTQVQELGTLETPILLTGTLSTFRTADHLIAWMLARPGLEHVRSINPVVGETNDGYLSDIRRRPIEFEHVEAALRSASEGPVVEGCVGAGTGTRCLGYKGGIGSASRRLPVAGVDRHVGVLAQTNFGGTLTVAGSRVGDALRPESSQPDRDGSCMIVVATDAALDARQLSRLAKRAVFGMGRVGASYSHGSGDYAIAFSTALASSEARVDDCELSPVFEATLEAVEEAILNSLLQATTTRGFEGRVCEAIDPGRLKAALLAAGVELGGGR